MQQPLPTIHTIVCHHRPHLDEIVAIWILQLFGEKVFPGIKDAKIVYVDASSMPPEGRSVEEMETLGQLAVGVWRGRLDEHPGETTGRKESESACSLVLKALGLEQDRALAQISVAVTGSDLKGASSEVDLGACVKCLHRAKHPSATVIGWTNHALQAIYEALSAEQDPTKVSITLDLNACVRYLHPKYPNRSAEVIRWKNFALEAIEAAQVRFHGPVREEYVRNAQVTVVDGYRRKTRIVLVKTDGSEMLGFARSRLAELTKHGRADIVVLQNSRGQVLISVGRRLNQRVFNDLVLMIRVEERRIKGMDPRMNWTALMGGGTAPGVPEWFMHLGMRLLLNGGESSPGTVATQIPLERIMKLVRIAANSKAFEPKRQKRCLAGECTTTAQSPCPWYGYGLTRCRAIRAQEHEQRRAAEEAKIPRPQYNVR